MKERLSKMAIPLFIAALMAAIVSPSLSVSLTKGSFKDNFDIMFSESNFKTSDDGQIWFLSLDKISGCGFQTKQRYRFGWSSMRLKLVGGESHTLSDSIIFIFHFFNFLFLHIHKLKFWLVATSLNFDLLQYTGIHVLKPAKTHNC
ncbi:probable xyloglucan endotransglucosylase/hydrolase protein 8 isoform X1 [Amaranthus tricolor]|uniref:probable xyloglucan endotransglucosylase/hydrolase protein 8 isoform X1 n=1 Tax=Amaranthus tricolor TaxID=29722 RepID=UPI002591141B|nr:probable xyloglucan endotransglucosylase/hydrolase protein 8 isoform X1 [Amaranthus tricolor]